jgi:DEAD/DEAH box helicase domain-containing protein
VTPPTGDDLVRSFPGDVGRATVHERPARPAETVDPSQILRPDLAARYPHAALYSHQATALDLLDAGEDVAVATATASGKTDIFALQAARTLLDAGVLRGSGERTGEGGATALLVYPMKALTGDQLANLRALYDEMGLRVRVERYDGDTPRADRREIREEADVVLTNPMGLNVYLGHHDRWARFFGDLSLVVVDESHEYTGALGAHVAWVLRRLARVVDHWGGDPRYVCSSATLGNPAAHSRALTGRDVRVVDDDGSPRGPRDVVLWNPPATESGDERAVDSPQRAPGAGTGVADRVPASVAAPRVWAHLRAQGVRSLLFCPSRKLTELAVGRAEEWWRECDYGDLTDLRVAPYNAGLGKRTRRTREQELRTGSLGGLATTSALELGIDVGDLDATVLTGYPGSRRSVAQRVGRAGRGERRSVGVLVADHATLDQYVVEHPEFLLDGEAEDAVVDVQNDAVFAHHVLCAADELALTERDAGSFADEGRLRRAVDMWRRVGRVDGGLMGGVHHVGRRPQADVNFYGVGEAEYDLTVAEGLDADLDLDLDAVSEARVARDFHEGAVRLLDGRQFEVVEVTDDPVRRVTLAPVDVDYYTRTLTDVNVVDAASERTRETNGFCLHHGTGTVVVHHHSYDRVDATTNDPLERALPTDRPPVQMETTLCWVEVPADVEAELIARYAGAGTDTGTEDEGLLGLRELGYVAGLHAAEHAVIGVAPLELLVDREDLGGLSTLVLDAHYRREAATSERTTESLAAVEATVESRARDETTGPPASGWFVYDGIEGGIGLSGAVYDEFESLAARAADRLRSCDCGRPDGCPACTYSPNCGNDNAPLLRAAAVDVLDLVAGEASLDAEGDRPVRRPTLFYA